MKKYYILGILMLFAYLRVYATHVRAGDLTAERISANSLTYKFTATIFTDDAGVDPDEVILFNFGDGTSAEFARLSSQSIGNQTTKNVYEAIHTFQGPGEYKVGVLVRNRNAGINNIPNSVNLPFYIESTFLINPFLGLNTSPILLIPPVDFLAAVGVKFTHNPGAIDIDGDSLAYRLVVCKENRATDVNGYTFPNDPIFGGQKEDGSGAATLTLDPITGDLCWDAPGKVGEYNVAFIVEEWRDGVLIGQVNRDMQILVKDNPNRPPVISPLDTCVIATFILEDTVISTDPNQDFVSLEAFSELFDPPGLRDLPKKYAEFKLLNVQPPNGEEQASFNWETVCEDVRVQPYKVTYRSVDSPNPLSDKLTTFETWLIRVIGPAPDTLISEVNILEGSIKLSWNSYACPNASKMTVWRREGSFNFTPDSCETGLPDGSYEQIGEVDINQTEFLDDNNGEGLEKGKTYCYRIYAVFPLPGGGESIVSMEVCETIPSLAPLLINVNVDFTKTDDGEIFVRWVKPLQTDTVEFPRPYTYKLFRAETLRGTTNYTEIPQIFEENDTTYLDKSLNTSELAYNYTVHVFGTKEDTGELILVDSSQEASSVRLEILNNINQMDLAWAMNTPWATVTNQYKYHYIFRSIAPDTVETSILNRDILDTNGAGFVLYDSVDVTVDGFTYTDLGKADNPLVDGERYCYFVVTKGTYSDEKIREPLFNKSQIACQTLQIDNPEPPCEPSSVVFLEDTDCSTITDNIQDFCDKELYDNVLNWQVSENDSCESTNKYNIYFAAHSGEELELIATVNGTSFTHQQVRSIAGCYAIRAVDIAGNESEATQTLCIDNCPYFELPNVFTPNEDGVNDTFHPFDCPLFVKKVEFRVFNRWGKEVYFSDDDVFINWTGVNNAGTKLSAGVYYYEAQVQFYRLNQEDEDKIETIKGSVHLIR
jgi:gliding motility-associated-like protein